MRKPTKNIQEALDTLWRAIEEDKAHRSRLAWVHGIQWALGELEKGVTEEELWQVIKRMKND
jgi:hypothetical protein